MQGPDRDDEDVRTTLRELISKSEALFATIGEEGAQRYRDAIVALERQLRRARDQLEDLQYGTLRRARVAAQSTDRYAHANPWTTAAGAAALGAAVGALVALLIVRLAGPGGDSTED